LRKPDFYTNRQKFKKLVHLLFIFAAAEINFNYVIRFYPPALFSSAWITASCRKIRLTENYTYFPPA
jgi:hypothetical protein